MTTPPRILVCDHRGNGLERDAVALGQRGFAVEVCTSLRQSLLRLDGDAEGVDLVLLAPLSAGGEVEITAIDRARGDVTPIPLLVVVGREDERATLRLDSAIAAPLWDTVQTDAPIEELHLRIERQLMHAKLLEEMNELRHRASHDDRTDLLRPRAFQARLLEHFSAAHRHKLHLALILVDLDRFGAINKLHDHTVGDRLIAQVGEVIRGTLRAEDVAGRLGGDEFAVLLPYTKKIDAARVVNRLRDEIAKLSGQPEGARGPIQVSASLGFETFDGTDLDSVETLRRHAERALRHAKVSGGDRGVYYRDAKEKLEERT